MKVIVVFLFILLSSGCATYSISDVGYSKKRAQVSKELAEFQVVGINKNIIYSQEDIQRAFDSYEELQLEKDSNIMVLQSGAAFPDSELIQSLSKNWNVNFISGDNREYEGVDLNNFFRFAAASSGSDYLLAYWGVIETAQKRKVHSSQISWVPIVGWGLPDKDHAMRMRLKFVVMNVKTGHWQAFSTNPVEATFSTSLIGRDDSAQHQIIELKERAYKLAVQELIERFSKVK